MARPGITKEQIIQAADTLLQETGAMPTVQAVRERIGSGSYTTINTTLTEWRKEYAERIIADVPAMPDKVQAAFNQAWSIAVRQTQEDMEAERQAIDTKRREMEKEHAGMSAEIEQLEKALEEAIEKTGRIEEELNREKQAREETTKKLDESSIENARLDERAKAAEARADEMKKQIEDLQEKMAEIAKRRTEAKKEEKTD